MFGFPKKDEAKVAGDTVAMVDVGVLDLRVALVSAPPLDFELPSKEYRVEIRGCMSYPASSFGGGVQITAVDKMHERFRSSVFMLRPGLFVPWSRIKEIEILRDGTWMWPYAGISGQVSSEPVVWIDKPCCADHK